MRPLSKRERLLVIAGASSVILLGAVFILQVKGRRSLPEDFPPPPSMTVTETNPWPPALPPSLNDKKVDVAGYIDQQLFEDATQYVPLNKVKGSVLLVIKEPLPFTDEEIFNTSKRLYSLMAVHPSGSLQKVGSFAGLEMHGTQGPKLKGDYVYFRNNTNGISRFNLRTKEISQVLTELTDQQNQINDFVVTGESVYYLRGVCGEGGKCSLVQYHTGFGSSRVILDSIKSGVICGNGLSRYDPMMEEVIVIKGCGDAGESSFDVFGVDVESGNVRKIDSVSFSSGTNPDGDWPAYLEKLHQYDGTSRYCGNTHVYPSAKDAERLVVGTYEFSNAKVVGCLQ